MNGVPRPILIALALLLAGGTAAAHGLGTSQLRLRLDGARLEGDWEIQLADARRAMGRDPQVAGEVGWRELREPELRAYLGRRLAISGCSLALTLPAQWQGEQGQFLVRFAAACASVPTRLTIRCDLLFDVDPRHRAYFSLEDDRVTHVGVFSDRQRSVTIEVRTFHFWSAVREFAIEGMTHVWSGLDHVLFLLALLLPAPLLSAAAGWSPRPGLGAAAREVVKVVSAFTLAHSLTLCLSFFGLLTLPARWVEVAIAFSVFAAAWNNLRRFLPDRAWVMALVFGLVHGLGFAGALRNLSLPARARGLPLAAFNGGVELGQLVIVAAALPLLYAASRRRWYPRLMMGAASLVIAWLAVLWILERSLGIPLLARL
jgi:HupE/UreJ protein